jgi:hypothetical protein
MNDEEREAMGEHPEPGTVCTCPLCCPQKYAQRYAENAAHEQDCPYKFELEQLRVTLAAALERSEKRQG